MTKPIVRLVFAGIGTLFFSLFITNTPVLGVTTIDRCGILSQPGETYLVSDNIVPTKAGFCIYINADNITLDCKDHTISGIGENTFGIIVYLAKDVIVKNCVVEKFETGILDSGGQNNKFENNTSRNNEFSGMVISGKGSIIYRNTLYDNGTSGLSVSGSQNYINNNISHSNMGDGIILANIGGHIATKNLSRHNKFSGLLVNSSVSNQLVKNRTNFNERNGIYLLGNTKGNVVDTNSSEKNSWHGFEDNTLLNNKVKNKYKDNRCLDNVKGGSHPTNLCKPQP